MHKLIILVIVAAFKTLDGNIFIACFKNDDSKALKSIIKRNFDINKPQIINGERGTLLYHACKHNKNIVNMLLSSKKLKVDSKAFILAAKKNSLAILKLGIRQGINIDCMIYGETALDAATLYEQEEAARLLLEHNATINLKASFTYAAHNRWIWFLEHAIDQGIKEDANWDGFFDPKVLTDRATYNFLRKHEAFKEHDRWCKTATEWQVGPYNSRCRCAPYKCPRYSYNKYDCNFVSSKLVFDLCMQHDDEEYTTQCIQDNKFAVNEPVYPHALQDLPLLKALRGDRDSDLMLVFGFKYPERCYKNTRFNVIRSLLKAGAIVDKKSFKHAVMLNIIFVIRAALEQGLDLTSISDLLDQAIINKKLAVVRLLLDADILLTEKNLIQAARVDYWWVLAIAYSRGMLINGELYNKIKNTINNEGYLFLDENRTLLKKQKKLKAAKDFFQRYGVDT